MIVIKGGIFMQWKLLVRILVSAFVYIAWSLAACISAFLYQENILLVCFYMFICTIAICLNILKDYNYFSKRKDELK